MDDPRTRIRLGIPKRERTEIFPTLRKGFRIFNKESKRSERIKLLPPILQDRKCCICDKRKGLQRINKKIYCKKHYRAYYPKDRMGHRKHILE